MLYSTKVSTLIIVLCFHRHGVCNTQTEVTFQGIANIECQNIFHLKITEKIEQYIILSF